MPLTRHELRALYRKRAKRYDFTSNLYYLVGFRMGAFRKKAVAALRVRPGDTVVEIGCGTGLNFSLLHEAVGPSGKIIGVDMTDAMLYQAKQRIVERGWSNVELVQSDAASYEFPPAVGGVISTFALAHVPQFDDVIRRGAAALSPGKQWVVAELKLPTGWIRHLAPVALPFIRPFGVTLDMADRRPWESMQRYLEDVTVAEFYLGSAYIANGGARVTH